MRMDLARDSPPTARKQLFLKAIPIITRFAYISIWIRIHMSRNGFALWHKVIESRQRFHWPRLLEQPVVTLSTEQLEWLLDGYDIWTQPHEMLRFSHAA